MITPEALAAQEARFAEAFAKADLTIARPLYHPEVVYLSPAVRVFKWPARVVGIDRTLTFIGLTIRKCPSIDYRAVETAIVPGADVAFVRVHFDWTVDGQRVRSNYVVIYRYRDGLIGQQELYYDPSGRLETV